MLFRSPKNAMHIVNIIGMSDRRVSNLNINIIEQNASPNMASIRDNSLPIPNGSGNVSDIWSKSLILYSPCIIKSSPDKSLNESREMSNLRFPAESGNNIFINRVIITQNFERKVTDSASAKILHLINNACL